MRFAIGALASAAILFAAAAVGLVGTWGLPVGAVALVIAAVMAAGAMEADDPFGVEGLARQREALGNRFDVANPVDPR
jgi:hypothetical protein